MKELRAEILINATPQRVWKILTEFDNYETWNPFIKSIRGTVAAGKKISVRIEPPGQNGMTFRPVVKAFEPNKELRWLGHLFIPGLFDGEHKFELVDNGNGTTRFIQSENFTGILVPLFKKMLDQNTAAGFGQMNKELKVRAEAAE